MRHSRLSFFAVWLIAIGACSSATEPHSTQLRASSDGSAVTLENPNDWAIYYVIVNPNLLAVMDWAPCTDAATCPHVTAHGSFRVAYADIGGYQSGETTATIYQWRVRRRLTGEYETTDLQQSTVLLAGNSP